MRGLLSRWSTQASQRSGFSCCKAPPKSVGFAVVGMNSVGVTWDLVVPPHVSLPHQRVNSCHKGHRAVLASDLIASVKSSISALMMLDGA